MTEAFETAEAFLASGSAARAQCLVLDIQLPGMSGIDLHQRLLSVGDTTPTIFITAREDSRVRELRMKGQDA